MKLWTEEDAERIRIEEEQKMMERLAQKKFDALGETLCVVDKRNRISKYNKDSFFPIGAESFSDGFGGEWFYEDRNETWSDNPLEFYEKFCEKNNCKIDAFDVLIKNITNASLSDSQKIKLQTAFVKGFYGTMYGEPREKSNEIVRIEPFKARIGNDGALYYVWGWPGPDYNVYKIDDYGTTWSLTEDEIRLPHHKRWLPIVFSLQDNIKIVKFKEQKDGDGYYFQFYEDEFAVIGEDEDGWYDRVSLNGHGHVGAGLNKNRFEFVRFATQNDIDILNKVQVCKFQ